MFGYSNVLLEIAESDRLRKNREVKASLISRFKAKLEQIPEAEPIPLWMGLCIFGGLALVGTMLGAVTATYIFFGILTLAGLAALVERNKYLRYLVAKSNFFLDVAIFIATVYATAFLGITLVGSLTVAGLGYTLVYAPWLRLRSTVHEQETVPQIIEISYETIE